MKDTAEEVVEVGKEEVRVEEDKEEGDGQDVGVSEEKERGNGGG